MLFSMYYHAPYKLSNKPSDFYDDRHTVHVIYMQEKNHCNLYYRLMYRVKSIIELFIKKELVNWNYKLIKKKNYNLID